VFGKEERGLTIIFLKTILAFKKLQVYTLYLETKALGTGENLEKRLWRCEMVQKVWADNGGSRTKKQEV